MKRIFIGGLMVLACLGLNVMAQDWYQDREARYRAEEWRAHLFQHVRVDLDPVASVTWPRGSDRYRLDRTRHELDDLQGKLANHYFDGRELNDVIGSLNRVVADNRMDPRDRGVLNDDLNRLRDYRDHHEHWIH